MDDSKAKSLTKKPLCHLCAKSFSKLSNLYRHFKQSHTNNGGIKYDCNTCGKVLSTKHSRSMHEIKCRSNQKRLYECSICKERFSELNQHLLIEHNINIDVELVEVDSFSEFEQWKLDIEKQTISHYIRTTSRKIVGQKAVYYYSCHRSGHFRNVGKQNKRRAKRMGSNKIDGFCPARLLVTQEIPNGKIKIKYVKTHVGHEAEIQRIPLSKPEREYLAGTIKMKVPFDEILRSLRNNVSDECFQRINLVKRKDLINIEKSLKLSDKAMRCKKKSNNESECTPNYSVNNLDADLNCDNIAAEIIYDDNEYQNEEQLVLTQIECAEQQTSVVDTEEIVRLKRGLQEMFDQILQHVNTKDDYQSVRDVLEQFYSSSFNKNFVDKQSEAVTCTVTKT